MSNSSGWQFICIGVFIFLLFLSVAGTTWCVGHIRRSPIVRQVPRYYGTAAVPPQRVVVVKDNRPSAVAARAVAAPAPKVVYVPRASMPGRSRAHVRAGVCVENKVFRSAAIARLVIKIKVQVKFVSYISLQFGWTASNQNNLPDTQTLTMSSNIAAVEWAW